jgi:hypothetical protein
MEAPPTRRNDELRRRNRRVNSYALLASLLIHVLLFLIFRGDREPPSPFSAAGPREGDDRAAAGGGLQAINFFIPPEPQEIVRPPEPIPTPEAIVELQRIETDPQPMTFAEFDGLAGTQKGPEQGPGLESGDGRGDGGNAREGLFRVVPPSPRGLILPPSDRPNRIRGKEVTVYVFVTERGRVVPDSTRLRPPTGDNRFDDRLMRQAAEWVFEPARRGGKPVAEWFQYVITM